MGDNCLGGICPGVYVWFFFVWGGFVLEPGGKEEKINI